MNDPTGIFPQAPPGGGGVSFFEDVQPGLSGGRKTILVVDDTHENIHLLCGILGEEYRVQVALNGERALRIAATKPQPDLILLDIVMPGMDGYEVMRLLRSSALTMDIPVIFVSAKDLSSDEQLGLDLGAIDYFYKPFVPPVFLARIRNHLHLKAARDQLKDQNIVLEEKVEKRTRDLLKERSKLARLVQVGIGLSSERHEDRLLDSILSGAMEISGADAGILYIRTQDDQLAVGIVRANTLRIYFGGQSGKSPPFPKLPMRDSTSGQTNLSHVALRVVHARSPVNVPDVYQCPEEDFVAIRRFDKLTGYRSKSLLVVPMFPRGGEVVGVLQLLNSHDPDREGIVPFSSEIQSFVEALAAQAAIALDNHNLVRSQSHLLDSFVEVISMTIDAKSTYTGGHCTRVAEVARQLAQAACAKKDGSLADFSFNSEEEWREFRFA
ncbi:MAG: response regulator, partial [Magnetococcales bacterium]|nr:response regulator [Magnetococcales bacterium]